MSTPPYSGVSLLENMESATNYNNHVADLILRHRRGTKILEFGAGTGTIAAVLKDRNVNVECWELDPGLREQLKKRNLTTISSFPNAPQKWDTIYSVNVLEHVDNDREAVQLMSGQLTPGGVIIAYVPAFMLLYSSVDKNIGHHRRYTADSLKSVFSGMNILRCEYADSLGFFAGLAFKALDDGSGHVSSSSISMYDTFAFPISKMLDVGLRHLLGKNVLIVAENP